jgi:hypothetical protein
VTRSCVYLLMCGSSCGWLCAECRAFRHHGPYAYGMHAPGPETVGVVCHHRVRLKHRDVTFAGAFVDGHVWPRGIGTRTASRDAVAAALLVMLPMALGSPSAGVVGVVGVVRALAIALFVSGCWKRSHGLCPCVVVHAHLYPLSAVARPGILAVVRTCPTEQGVPGPRSSVPTGTGTGVRERRSERITLLTRYSPTPSSRG